MSAPMTPDTPWRAAPLLLVLLAACASAPPGPEPLCTARRAPDAPAEVLPEEWAALLVHGWDAKTQAFVGAALDCTGAPIASVDVDEDCKTRSEPPLAPRPRRGPPSAVVGALSDTERLVWIPLLQGAEGEAVGPLARVVQRPGALDVVALGTARGLPDRPLLRMATLGGVDLALLEGERCDGASCQRALRLVPQRGRRFIPEPLVSLTGTCAGPAVVWMRRWLERSGGAGVVQRYELESTVAPSATELDVHEQLLVKERAVKTAATGARLSRNAQADRRIVPQGGRIQVDGPSLWARLREFSPLE